MGYLAGWDKSRRETTTMPVSSRDREATGNTGRVLNAISARPTEAVFLIDLYISFIKPLQSHGRILGEKQ